MTFDFNLFKALNKSKEVGVNVRVVLLVFGDGLACLGINRKDPITKAVPNIRFIQIATGYQKTHRIKEIQEVIFLGRVLNSLEPLFGIGLSVGDHWLLIELCHKCHQVLDLRLFPSLREFPVSIDESHNAGDGDNRREEGGQSFRTEPAEHLRESYVVSGLAASYFNPKLPRSTTGANYPPADSSTVCEDGPVEMKKIITAVSILVLASVPFVAQQVPQTAHVSSVARGDQRTGMGEPCALHTGKLCYQYTDYTVENR